ncbi:MAG: flagellar basal body L-ring protein FlgH [Burkholderiaceae bacterium]
MSIDRFESARRLARRAIVVLALGGLLAGCSFMQPAVDVTRSTTPAPLPAPMLPPEPAAPGAIFSQATWRPLFEDRRARLVGDILSVKISEKTSASQSSNRTIDRKSSISGSITALPFTGAGSLARANMAGSSGNTFSADGENGSDNVFTGDITVTVIEVFANGNLRVAGEKQVGLNGNIDVLRFSGIVGSTSIRPDNTVLSSQVADARLDFSGRGPIGESQVMGWLSRFFLSWLPI